MSEPMEMHLVTYFDEDGTPGTHLLQQKDADYAVRVVENWNTQGDKINIAATLIYDPETDELSVKRLLPDEPKFWAKVGSDIYELDVFSPEWTGPIKFEAVYKEDHYGNLVVLPEDEAKRVEEKWNQ